METFVHHFSFLVASVWQRCGSDLVLRDRILLRGRIGLVSGGGSGRCGGPLLAQGPSSSGLLAQDLSATLMVWSH